jgi:hypothetical protein
VLAEGQRLHPLSSLSCRCHGPTTGAATPRICFGSLTPGLPPPPPPCIPFACRCARPFLCALSMRDL